jgi:glutamine amidotransferase
MIAVIDYGMGNLRSVQKALERAGGRAEIVSSPEQAASAEKIVLPGVGGFGDAIVNLKREGWVELIQDSIESGKPFLGICLGLQLLFDVSYEDGEHQGLGVFTGDVVRFDLNGSRNVDRMKVPHMGWNQIGWSGDCPLLRGVEQDSFVYFVHSYYVRPTTAGLDSIFSDYCGRFVAGVWRDAAFAVQFHPEKSQEVGLKMLANFVNLR